MRRAALLMCFALLVTASAGQTLEDWLEAAPDAEALALWLGELRANPIDLNRASVEEIAALPLFDALASERIVEARTHHGSFHSLSQVLTLSGLAAGQREVLRTCTTVQLPRRGRTPDLAANLSTGTESKEWQRAGAWWLRGRADFRRESGPRGFVFLKRAAESPQIAEQVSAGLEFQPGGLPSRVLVGDFQAECGTGLVFAAAYGMANWLSTREGTGPSAARGLALRPAGNYRSGFRGAALELERYPLKLTVLGSRVPLDAAVNGDGILRITEGEAGSSVELARARQDQIDERLLGLAAQGGIGGVTAGVAGYEARYAPDLSVAEEAVLPQLTGSRVDVGSVFLQARRGVARFIGEVAASKPGGRAWQAALEARQEQFSLTLYHIHADADFFSLRAKPWGGFGEAASNANVRGVRAHADWPGHALWVAASASRTPFRTSTSPLCRSASELDVLWRLRLKSASRLDLSAARRERDEYTVLHGARRVVLDRARVDVQGGEGDSYRIRYEVRSAARSGEGAHPLGTLLYLQAKARLWSMGLWGRLTFFDFSTDDVATSVSEFLPLGGSPLVPLTGTGRRAALALTRDFRGANLMLKLAQTHSVGSGSAREDFEFALQLSYRRY